MLKMEEALLELVKIARRYHDEFKDKHTHDFSGVLSTPDGMVSHQQYRMTRYTMRNGKDRIGYAITLGNGQHRVKITFSGGSMYEQVHASVDTLLNLGELVRILKQTEEKK